LGDGLFGQIFENCVISHIIFGSFYFIETSYSFWLKKCWAIHAFCWAIFTNWSAVTNSSLPMVVPMSFRRRTFRRLSIILVTSGTPKKTNFIDFSPTGCVKHNFIHLCFDKSQMWAMLG
jgi:hypothetical protein